MSEQKESKLKGPDLENDGVAGSDIPAGEILLGHAAGQQVIVVRKGDDFFALGATCTHYGGPLAEGIFDGERVRCPWHHACFAVETGDVVRPPALDPVDAFTIEVRDGRVFVGRKSTRQDEPAPIEDAPASVVIIGGGAAGNMAAETLRREGYEGPVTMLSADDSLPYDRPNLSKDYLAGKAPEDWIPLRSADFYREQNIDVRLATRVTAIDPQARNVTLEDGSALPYGALLLATGADPVKLDLPGADRPHVRYLRSLADSRAIIERVAEGRSAVVIGASFIGLEVAASLVTRGMEVHVVAPEAIPMEKVLGRELGEFVRKFHEEHGVTFHLEHEATAIGDHEVTLKGGETVPAELIVIGVGVRPAVGLAEAAGLTIDKGVVVDEYLAAAPGIWAAGDIARWPDRYTGERLRIEHWVHAERQGQTAALNILGRREPFDIPPFFWSQHYDVSINYVGHAEKWDRLDVIGSIDDHDCVVAYRKGGKTLAVASIFRDRESLEAELAMERGDAEKVAAVTGGGGA